MRLPRTLAFTLLALCSLACGLTPPCDEARPERDRALTAYRTALQGRLRHYQEELRTSETARDYGADSVASGSIGRLRRDLATLDQLEQRWAENDTEGATPLMRELENSFNARHPEIDTLSSAARAADHCVE